MKVYKRTYKDKKTGKKKRCQRYVVDFIDNDQVRRRLPAFSKKRESEQVAEKIEWLLSCQGRSLSPELSQWLEQIPPRMHEQFVKFGLLNSKQAAMGTSLTKHLEDFKQSLLAKSRTKKHINQTIQALSRIFDACKLTYWGDISASQMLQEISEFRIQVEVVEFKKINGKKVKKRKSKDLGPISARTFNFHLKAVKQFCRWMVQDRRASESPVSHLECVNEKIDRRHDRRPLEPDQIRHLLEITKDGPKRFGMTGYERALLYRLAIETGLRAKELRSLRGASFDFNNLTVTAEIGYTKNKKVAILPLRKDTAAELQAYLSSKMPNIKAFDVPIKTADMLKEDLAVAGIPYVDDAERYVDFHALRHTTGSLLAASGTHPKVAQDILRHSDINLTMSLYTHTLRGQKSEAVANLPDLSQPSKERQKAIKTGTDDESATGNDWTNTGQNSAQQRLSANSGEQKKRGNDSETAFLNGRYRARTCDPLIKSQLLCQLS